jgi:predicted MFS family arabinose efflux permease
MTQTPAPRGEGRSALFAAVAGCVAMASAMGVGRFAYTPILPAMMEGAGLTPTQAGSIASANFLGYLVGAILATTPQACAARPATVVLMLAVSAATGAAMAVVSSLTAFAAVRFVSGLASAFVFVGVSAVVVQALLRRGRTGLTWILYAGVGVGIATSSALVALALARFGDWRAPWLATAAASALACAIVALLLPRDPPAAAGQATERDGRPVWPIVVAYGLWGFGYVITATFLVALVREAGTGSETLTWMMVGLAAAPSVPVWGHIGTRFGLGRALAMAFLIEAAAVALSAVAPGAALAAAALFGGTFMGITALALGAARQSAGGDPRRILGLMTIAMSVGQLVGPPFAGMLRERAGSYLLPSLAAAGALALCAVLALRWQAARRP